MLAKQLGTVTVLAQLQHNVDVLLVLKIVVIFYNVGVVATAVNGDFVAYQTDEIFRLQPMFGDTLQSKGSGVNGRGGFVNGGETTATQNFTADQLLHVKLVWGFKHRSQTLQEGVLSYLRVCK